jgi:tRNA(fMet)-specific endonuclease VapC
MLYLLDTDHLVVLERRTTPAYANLTGRLRQNDPSDLFVSIVSFHEQMQGWLALLNRSTSSVQIVLAYRKLEELGRSFFEMNVLPFDDEAQQRYAALRQQRIRIGTMDLRIACVALEQGATVLTANANDFSKVPGLTIDDWTK